MSGADTAGERLQEQWRALQRQWQATSEVWRDPVQRRFEREFWDDWERLVPAGLETMRQLAEVIIAARRSVR